VIKSRTIRITQFPCGERWNAYRIFVGESKVKYYLEVSVVNGRMVSKCFLKKC